MIQYRSRGGTNRLGFGTGAAEGQTTSTNTGAAERQTASDPVREPRMDLTAERQTAFDTVLKPLRDKKIRPESHALLWRLAELELHLFVNVNDVTW